MCFPPAKFGFVLVFLSFDEVGNLDFVGAGPLPAYALPGSNCQVWPSMGCSCSVNLPSKAFSGEMVMGLLNSSHKENVNTGRACRLILLSNLGWIDR